MAYQWYPPHIMRMYQVSPAQVSDKGALSTGQDPKLETNSIRDDVKLV